MIDGYVDFGFKDEYIIDLADTVVMYQSRPDMFEKSQCYYNAYKLLDALGGRGDRGRIVYGYVLSTDGKRKVAVRHSWNDIDDRKIDVTMLANDENLVSMMHYRYLPIDKYSLDVYRKLVLQNGAYDLPETDREYAMVRRLKDKGFEVLG